MREIKFRAWDKDFRKMFNVVELSYEDDKTLAWREPYKNERVSWIKSGLEVGKECDLLQYTGLKDWHGTPIYEGDIVKGYWWRKGESHRHIGKVTYGMAAFKVVGVKQYLGMVDKLSPVYEVIGNIHEDGDLLENPKS